MAELLIYEPSSERERLLLDELHSVDVDIADIKVIKKFNVLRNRLAEIRKQIVIIDFDFLPDDEKKPFLAELNRIHTSLTVFGVSDLPSDDLWPISISTGIFIVPFNHRLKLELKTLIQHANKLIVRQKSFEEPEEIKFIGKHPSIKQIIKKVDLIANSDANVLITGATGSGKTILAKLIHIKSSRCNEPFFHINCAAIPDQLLEAELFGYKKGAFTGANKDTTGKFKAAGRGTILLDEIGEMPVHLQAKLLKVLDEGQYYPIGATQMETVAARIIAATNKDILQEIQQKHFRMDLYYRLNSFEIQIPPLKERVEDIPLLFNFYIDIYIKKRKIPKPQIQPSIYEVLRSYNWPGNIRELQNLVETLLYMRPEYITLDMLPQKFFTNFTAELVKNGEEFLSLDEVKKSYARYVLGLTDGRKSKAAKILGIDIKTFNKLIKEI